MEKSETTQLNYFLLLVLNELPLSDTLTSQSANKSLLFHPRVAEEAKNVLNQRDDALAQQLINAIQQTDSSYM
jgi:cohesin loading factor subunit SCC2